MTPLELWFDPYQEEGLRAGTSTELDAALDTVAARSTPQWYPVAEVAEAGQVSGVAVLHVGFRGEVGVLRFMTSDGQDAFWSHDTTNPDASVVVYQYQDNDLQAPTNAQLPIGDVRRAVHEFAATGQRPEAVSWQRWSPPVTTGSTYPTDHPGVG